MKYLFNSLILIFAVSIFSGCQNSPTVVVNHNWPVVIETSLQGKMIVTNSVSRKRSDSLSEVQFSLKNLQLHSDIDALYKIRWFDRDGFMIKSITDTFMKIHLGPDEEKIFSVISISPKVLTYKVTILDYDENKKRIPDEDIQENK